MKKLIYFAMILALAFVSCKKEDKPITVPESWETGLGVASFVTDQTWTVSGNGIKQIWSDAVQTVDCGNKTSFDGGNSETGAYNIDCRSNNSFFPNYKGDLFSWRAVTEVQNLCPEGWRVPTVQDFTDLDIALGFNGENREPTEVNGHSWQDQLDTYLTTWGGAYGGLCSDGWLYNQDFSGAYWSQSEDSADNGFSMHFRTSGRVYPQGSGTKRLGYTLRCIHE